MTLPLKICQTLMMSILVQYKDFLDLKVLKTKEMLTDYRKNPPNVPYLEIDDKIVERVDEYKYLGTVIDSSLAFNKSVDAIHRKCQPRLYYLHKLRNVGIDSKILQMYYKCCIEYLLSFVHVLVWKPVCSK